MYHVLSTNIYTCPFHFRLHISFSPPSTPVLSTSIYTWASLPPILHLHLIIWLEPAHCPPPPLTTTSKSSSFSRRAVLRGRWGGKGLAFLGRSFSGEISSVSSVTRSAICVPRPHLPLSLCLSIALSLSLSPFLSLFVSLLLPVSIFLSIYLFPCISVTICSSISICFSVSFYFSIFICFNVWNLHLSLCFFTYLSINLFLSTHTYTDTQTHTYDSHILVE